VAARPLDSTTKDTKAHERTPKAAKPLYVAIRLLPKGLGHASVFVARSAFVFFVVRNGSRPLTRPQDQSDLSMPSTIFLASPNSIMVLSRKKSSFSTPA